MRSLAAWREALQAIDWCPWPGPRPLEAHEGHLLAGREEAIAQFAFDVIGHRLVILTGDSGAGKSSLLNAGLVPALEASGFIPLVCKEWSEAPQFGGGAQEFRVERFLREQLARAGKLPPGLNEDSSFTSALQDELGSKAVVILDQFEELIRYHSDRFDHVTEWVLKVNKHSDVKVILSLRAEYEHKLRGIERGAAPFSTTRVFLEPAISRGTVGRVIDSGLHADGTPAISTMARDALLETWQTAVPEDQSNPRFGLLHLQAALYSAYGHALKASLDVDEVSLVHLIEQGIERTTRDLRRRRPIVEEEHIAALGQAENRIANALRVAVEQRLERCETATHAPEANIDPYLRAGTKSMVARSVRHLSSGGFKLVRERWDLAKQVLEAEMERMATRLEAATPPALFSKIAASGDDLLSVSWTKVTSPLSAEERGHAPSWTDTVPWLADPGEVSSGPMLGLPARAVLVEEFRRFLFAMRWLEQARLVRTTSTLGDVMVSLIHDGFSGALDAWADREAHASDRWLHTITAATGADFDRWESIEGTRDRHLILANLRWRDCRVCARFAWVVFVNCDFRGTRFENCAFEGVIFLNCLLDSALIGESVILGESGPAGQVDSSLPGFLVGDETCELARHLGHYRGAVEGGFDLVSRTSGLPVARVQRKDADERDEPLLEWQPHPGGLTMYGGRLSSLMIRGSRRGAGDGPGMIALRHVAGSGLDIVEQSGTRVRIDHAVVRGLTVTRPVDEVGGAPVDLRVHNSILADTWLGDRLIGTVHLEECRTWQMCSMGETVGATPDDDEVRDFLAVELVRTAYHGLVNIPAPADEQARIDGKGRREAGDSGISGGSRSEPSRSVHCQEPSEPRLDASRPLQVSATVDGPSSSGDDDGRAVPHPELVRFGQVMDYRSTPARREYERYVNRG